MLFALRLGMGNLDAILNPLTLFGVLDVHVFNADGARVGIAQDAKNFAEFHQWAAAEATCGKFTV